MHVHTIKTVICAALLACRSTVLTQMSPRFQTAADTVEENVSGAEQRNAMSGKTEREGEERQSDNDRRRLRNRKQKRGRVKKRERKRDTL